MNNIDETRIRKLAYQIWESEGCPDGRDERHWEMARSLALAEAEASGLSAEPATAPEPRTAKRNQRLVDKPVSVKKPGKPRTRKE